MKNFKVQFLNEKVDLKTEEFPLYIACDPPAYKYFSWDVSLTYPRNVFLPLFWVMLHPIDDRAEHLFFAVHVEESAGYQFVHLKMKKNR